MVTKPSGGDDPPRYFDRLQHRTQKLERSGVSPQEAFTLAALEMQIEDWPAAWGSDLMVLVYGDFVAPEQQLEFPELGITIESGNVTGTIIRDAITVAR